MNYIGLIGLGFCLNGALGSGKYDGININDVKKKIHDRTIFDYLRQIIKDYDGHVLLKPEEESEIIDKWQHLAHDVTEGEHMLVYRNGLCLLVAYILYILQEHESIA